MAKNRVFFFPSGSFNINSPNISENQPLLGHTKEERNRSIWRKDFCPFFPCRYVLAFTCFLGICIVYALRVNLSMAIVVMWNDSSSDPGLPAHKEFYWTSTEQGVILGSFFYGYILTQIPGGWLAHRFGTKYVFGIGIVVTALLTLLTPIAASVGVWCIVTVRFFEGLFEGVTFPSLHALWSKWAPPAERSRLIAFSYAGQYVGSVISFPLTALLCTYGFDGGWPSVFYIFGLVGILWFVVWLFVGYSSPATHPRISLVEKKFIETTIAEANQDKNHVPLPIIQIFLSPAVWAIITAHFCGNFGFYILLTTLPLYIKQLHLGQDIIKNGLLSALPYLAESIVVLFLAGPLADFLRAKCLSTGNTRKLMSCSSLFLSGVLLLSCGYFGTSTWIAMSLLTLSVAVSGFQLAGHCINHVDIAPRLSGVLMGITNGAGTIPGIIGPQIAKAMAHSDSNAPLDVLVQEWQNVFIVAAEVYIFGAIIYGILAQGNKQWWADGVKRRNAKNIPIINSDSIQK